MKYPVGTQYLTRPRGRLATVTDYHVTTNLSGEIVRERYVTTHELLGQTVTDRDVVAVTIARGLV